MTDALKRADNALVNLREAAKKVNDESDALREDIIALEDDLKSMGLGLQVRPKDDRPLGYGKIRNGKWGFFTTDRRWIIEISRIDRITLSMFLPDVMEELLSQSKTLVTSLGRARKTFQKEKEKLREGKCDSLFQLPGNKRAECSLLNGHEGEKHRDGNWEWFTEEAING